MQVAGQDSAAAAAPKGSVSSDDLPLIILRRPVPLPRKQSVLTADWVDSSQEPVQSVQSQEDASSCPSRQAHRQRVRRRSHRVLDDSDEETQAATAPGPQRRFPSSPQQLHLPRWQRLSSQVLEDSEEEAEAATAPVACTQDGKGGAAEAHEAHTQPAATQGRQLQQPPTNSDRQQEGQVDGYLRVAETCSADPGEAASSGSSQQPLRARLRRRQATKRSAQHAATGAKRKAKSPVIESPKRLREMLGDIGFQPDEGALSPPARQGSAVQADQAARAMPASHAEVQHAAGMADSAASQHTPAQGSPARTSHSLVTPVPEPDSSVREAPQAPQLGTASNQSPTRDLRQRQAELQVWSCLENGYPPAASTCHAAFR